jgi:hypothetical protein
MYEFYRDYIRNRRHYVVNDDHCTRCEQPFGGNRAVAHMVYDLVADDHYSQQELEEFPYLVRCQMIAVCDACVTDEERARLDADAICEGCDRPMRVNCFEWRQRHRYICASRCEARARRRQKRAATRARCSLSTCNKSFTPKRSDAKFCTNACRQRAYRLHHRGEDAPIDTT